MDSVGTARLLISNGGEVAVELTVHEGHALKVLAAFQAGLAALRERVLAQTALEGS
ncbi:hypothetical protein ACFYY1_40625 [Streptomyces sp. NPDC001890]|uniref:hypothetical protein n=1 Tax=Streptomyces sp. NPDC001890 TaxID=3364620 RepID=UPI0036A7400D